MANIRLYQFPSKASPVPADIVYLGDSANSFNEVQSTIAELIAAYPNLSGIAGLTLGANTYPYANSSAVITAGTITALGVSLLADSTIGAMQTTLGYTAIPAATLFAGWDAHSNLSANNFLGGYATTATAAGTTTLTVSSAYQQFFTGTTTQTVLLPVTSTLALGQSFYIVNNSTGAVTVQSSGANTIQVMAAGTTLLVTCISLTGTTAASWNADYNINTPLTLPLSISNGGTGVSSVTIAPPGLSAAAWAGWDANSNMSANAFISAYATTATAAATTTLTVSSKFLQYFTGSTTQTVLMPVTSTLVLGQQFRIVNLSSGNVTVQSSGANNIQVMAPGSNALLTCILTSGTTAASWDCDYSISAGASGTVNSGTNGQLAYYASTGTAVSGLALGTGVLTALGQNVSGSGSMALTTSPTFVTPTLGAATATSLAFSPTTGGIIGTTTNDNTGTGKVGEYVSSVIASASAVTVGNATATDITSISLTAGDWDVWGNINMSTIGVNNVAMYGWISTSSATLPDASLFNAINLGTTNLAAGTGFSVPQVRISIASTTTVYISAYQNQTSGTTKICGGIFARRVR